MNKRVIPVFIVALLGIGSSLGFFLLPNIWIRSKDAGSEPDKGHQAPKLLDASAYQTAPSRSHPYQPRKVLDTSGFSLAFGSLKPWKDPTSLEEIREAFVDLGKRNLARVDEYLSRGFVADSDKFKPLLFDSKIHPLLFKASMFMYEGEPKQAYQVFADARRLA